jgi:hypothetical protein
MEHKTTENSKFFLFQHQHLFTYLYHTLKIKLNKTEGVGCKYVHKYAYQREHSCLASSKHSDTPDWYCTVYTARMVATISEVKMSAASCDYIQLPPLHQIILRQMSQDTWLQMRWINHILIQCIITMVRCWTAHNCSQEFYTTGNLHTLPWDHIIAWKIVHSVSVSCCELSSSKTGFTLCLLFSYSLFPCYT